MNILSLDTRTKSNQGAFLHLKHPATGAKLYDGEGTANPVGLYIKGRDSDEFAVSTHKRNNERLSAKDPIPVTSEKIEQDGIELLASLTCGWENLKVGENAKFSQDAARDLYAKLPWVYEQANTFAGDRANFI
jgi:hypothetical protein